MNDVIQSLWIGDEISNVEKLCISSYVKNGHDFHLYTYGPVKGVPEGCEVKDAKEVLPQEDIFAYNVGIGKGSYSAFSNYFRYKLLGLKGGWWTDTDIVCLKTIDFKDDFVFATEKTADGKSHITSGIIKAPAGSEFCKYCYDFCKKQNKETLAWGTVGPRLVSKAVNALSLSENARPWRFFNPIGFEQIGMLFDETFGDMDLSRSYTIHLWNEMWRRYNLDKNKTYEQNCLFEKLKKKYL